MGTRVNLMSRLEHSHWGKLGGAACWALPNHIMKRRMKCKYCSRIVKGARGVYHIKLCRNKKEASASSKSQPRGRTGSQSQAHKKVE